MRPVGVDRYFVKRVYGVVHCPLREFFEFAYRDPVEFVDGGFPGDGPQVDGFPHIIHERQVIAPPKIQVVEHDFPGGPH